MQVCICACAYTHIQLGVPAVLSTCSNPIKALLLWGLVVLPSARPTAHLKTPFFTQQLPCLRHKHTHAYQHETKVPTSITEMHQHTYYPTIPNSGVCVASKLTSHHPGLLAAITLAPWALVARSPSPLCCAQTTNLLKDKQCSLQQAYVLLHLPSQTPQLHIPVIFNH